MPRVENIGKKSSAPRKILYMAFPDAQTLNFWKLTADDPREHAARIAKFSRVVGKNAVRNPVRSSERPRRDLATAVPSRRSAAPGRLLMMPGRFELDSRSSSRALEPNTGSLEGGNMKAPGIRAKKTGKRLPRGKALQVMVYPRVQTKRALVEACREVSLPLSSFMIMASLNAAAALQGCKVSDLIPQAELRQYLREK